MGFSLMACGNTQPQAEDADAYAAACEKVVARWNEEIIPLLVQ